MRSEQTRFPSGEEAGHSEMGEEILEWNGVEDGEGGVPSEGLVETEMLGVVAEIPATDQFAVAKVPARDARFHAVDGMHRDLMAEKGPNGGVEVPGDGIGDGQAPLQEVGAEGHSSHPSGGATLEDARQTGR